MELQKTLFSCRFLLTISDRAFFNILSGDGSAPPGFTRSPSTDQQNSTFTLGKTTVRPFQKNNYSANVLAKKHSIIFSIIVMYGSAINCTRLLWLVSCKKISVLTSSAYKIQKLKHRNVLLDTRHTMRQCCVQYERTSDAKDNMPKMVNPQFNFFCIYFNKPDKTKFIAVCLVDGNNQECLVGVRRVKVNSIKNICNFFQQPV